MSMKEESMIDDTMNQGMNRRRGGLCLNEAAYRVLDGLMKHVGTIRDTCSLQ